MAPIALPRNPSATSLTVRAPVSSTASESRTRCASAVVRTSRCCRRWFACEATSASPQMSTHVAKRIAQSREPRLSFQVPDATDIASVSTATTAVRRASA